MIGELRHSRSSGTTYFLHVRWRLQALEPLFYPDSLVFDVVVILMSRDGTEPVTPENLNQILVSEDYDSYCS